MDIETGKQYKVVYPFTRDIYGEWTEDGLIEHDTWRPGTRPKPIYPDDAEDVADAEGLMILEIISIHKPGKYPTRIFYTRKYQDPDGKVFGKGRLHIASVDKFRRLSAKYYYDYRVLIDTNADSD